mgnify:CR=1 FL=1
MSKNKSRMSTEKDLAKLIEEIKKQEFETTDEINDFLRNLQGQSLEDLPKRTDKKGRSEDLVFEAYEHPVSKGKKLVKQALAIDPNNVEAYNYLAGIEKDIDGAIKMFEKAIKVGEKALGKKFFKEEKGYFWGIMQTRPFMRAKAGLADCLYAKNEVDKAIGIYEEMMELNPNDNQGIRYLLSTLLLTKSDLTKFETFIENREDEDCAVWNYNMALYQFKKSGQSASSEEKLLKAYSSNKYVLDYMLGVKEMPKELPRYIGIGDDSEAVSYVDGSWGVWRKTAGALDWLYKFKQKRQKIN